MNKGTSAFSHILALEADCKGETARSILKEEEGHRVTTALVENLAKAGNTTPKYFSRRIIGNSNQAYETALKAVQMSGDVAKIEAIIVEYSVLKQYRG